MKRFLENTEIPPEAIVLDARAEAAYATGHIPGARHLEFLEKFTIKTPPQQAAFDAAVQTLVRRGGLHAGQRVVVYDAGRDTRAARLAWALEYAGFEVALLRGGFQSWDGATETVAPDFLESDFLLTQPRRELLATAEEVLHREPVVILLDARNAAEYSGAQVPPGATRGGHIPGAQNLNWEELTTEGGIKSDAELEARLAAIPEGSEVIVHCQSGARSSVLYHALRARNIRVRNYLGSMNEWAADESLPLETA